MLSRIGTRPVVLRALLALLLPLLVTGTALSGALVGSASAAEACTCRAVTTSTATPSGTPTTSPTATSSAAVPGNSNKSEDLTAKAAQRLRKKIDAAEIVVRGTVRAVDDVPVPQTFTLTLSRVYKGQVNSWKMDLAQSPTCPLLNVSVNQEWIVLAGPNTQGGDLPEVTACGGSTPVTTAGVKVLRRVLGNGTEAPKPVPAAAVLTKVEGSGPTRFTKMAAPGAAMVIVGLLGLIVVRRFGRPRPERS